MNSIYRLSPNKHLIYLIVLPIIIEISLAFTSYYISTVFVFVLLGVFYLNIVLNLIYNYYLGLKLSILAPNKTEQKNC